MSLCHIVNKNINKIKMSSEMTNSRIKTPEESEFNISIYQNYSASEVLVQGLAGFVNQPDVEIMIRAQKQMLQRFEKTNEMLLNCNALSAHRLKIAGEDFKKHIKLLSDMKKDLDIVFKKIRTIKTKLTSQYPQSFNDTQSHFYFAEEAEDLGEIVTEHEIQENKPTTSTQPNKNHTLEKKKVENTSVGYVKMSNQSPENVKTDTNTRRNSTSTSNESSDCTVSD